MIDLGFLLLPDGLELGYKDDVKKIFYSESTRVVISNAYSNVVAVLITTSPMIKFIGEISNINCSQYVILLDTEKVPYKGARKLYKDGFIRRLYPYFGVNARRMRMGETIGSYCSTRCDITRYLKDNKNFTKPIAYTRDSKEVYIQNYLAEISTDRRYPITLEEIISCNSLYIYVGKIKC
jgi:hypothetical protein